jgi:hypothetical protein
LRLFAPLLAWGSDGGLAGEGKVVRPPRAVNSPRATPEIDVTHMGQNANSQYATIVASKKKAPERCAKYGIKNQGTALSDWKQFTCAKFSYFFYGSMRPFTDYFPDYGGFTSRADCCTLLLWWLPSP